MASLEDLRAEAIDMLENDADLFISVVDELDNLNGFADGWRGYPMYELDELYGDMPLREFLQRITSEFDVNDEYFIETIYGLESTNDLAAHYWDNTTGDDVIDRILVAPLFSTSDSEFEDVIDEIQNCDEDEELESVSIANVVDRLIEGRSVRNTLERFSGKSIKEGFNKIDVEPDDELINVWLDDFKASGRSVEDEIKDIKGALSNERIWQKGSKTQDDYEMHALLIANYEAYLELLQDLNVADMNAELSATFPVKMSVYIDVQDATIGEDAAAKQIGDFIKKWYITGKDHKFANYKVDVDLSEAGYVFVNFEGDQVFTGYYETEDPSDVYMDEALTEDDFLVSVRNAVSSGPKIMFEFERGKISTKDEQYLNNAIDFSDDCEFPSDSDILGALQMDFEKYFEQSQALNKSKKIVEAVSKEKFLDYERIRQSGVTNMFDVTTVCALSDEGLTRDDCLDIMKHYGEYKEKWLKEAVNESKGDVEDIQKILNRSGFSEYFVYEREHNNYAIDVGDDDGNIENESYALRICQILRDHGYSADIWEHYIDITKPDITEQSFRSRMCEDTDTVVKYYVWKNGEHADDDGFFDYQDALDFALENDADEIEKTVWNSEDDYQQGGPADNFKTVWRG